MIQVSSLCKKERETVLNSKIVKENRKEHDFDCRFDTDSIKFYFNVVAIKGLLIRIQLSTNFEIIFACTSDHLKDFTNYLPALIAALVKADIKLEFIDWSFKSLNDFATYEIEKAGALIDYWESKFCYYKPRIMALATKILLWV